MAVTISVVSVTENAFVLIRTVLHFGDSPLFASITETLHPDKYIPPSLLLSRRQ